MTPPLATGAGDPFPRVSEFCCSPSFPYSHCPEDAANSPSGASTRFKQEAESLALLKHANIVTIHEFGKRADLYYFLMEFVAVQSLRRRCATAA